MVAATVVVVVVVVNGGDVGLMFFGRQDLVKCPSCLQVQHWGLIFDDHRHYLAFMLQRMWDSLKSPSIKAHC